MKRIFFIFLLLLIAESSSAEVYKWVDEKGVVNFTDDPTQIPEKNRPRVEKIRSIGERSDSKNEVIKKSPEKNKKLEDAYLDMTGKGEEYWRGRVEEWNNKLRESQEKVNSLRVKYNELTEKFNESKSSVERMNLRKERDQIKSEMDRWKSQIEEAKYMLEKKIPEEANLFKAKPEWLKQ